MLLTVEHTYHYFGFLGEERIQVLHRLSNSEAKELNEEGYCFCHAGSESPVFFSKKALVKAARKQARQLGEELELEL